MQKGKPPGLSLATLDRKALDMLHTRYTFGALVVVLDTATGRVDAVLHRLTDPMRNASELFSQTYIDAAVRAASLAWASTADH